jgi:hypothetical protein
MVPQQAHYQFRWLNVFEHIWACPFAFCYLLFAISAGAFPYPSAIAPKLITVSGADGDPGDPGVSL